MSVFNEEIYEEEVKVLNIRNNQSLDDDAKLEMMQEVREEKTKGNSSLKTILNLTNTNLGFILLVFGLQFKQIGFLCGIIAFALSMLITLKISMIQLTHCKSQDTYFTEIVARIMGEKARTIYNANACIYIFLGAMINFIYCTDMVYMAIGYFYELNGSALPGKDVFTFSRFSYQWVGVIMFVFFNLLFHIKDLKLLAYTGPIGVSAVLIVVLFSVVQGIINIKNFPDIFTFNFHVTDIALLMAALTLGSFGHYYHIAILKGNEKQENNRRDLIIAYVCAFSLYFIDAFFGSIALAEDTIGNQSSILDFFANTWYIFVIRLMILVQICTAVIFCTFVMKAKLWTLFPVNYTISFTLEQIVNLLASGIWLIIQFFNVNNSTLIALAGGVGAFLGLYFFPIIVHMKCLYSHKAHQAHSHDKTGYEHIGSTNDINESLISNSKNLAKQRSESLMETFSTPNEKQRCRSLHQNYMKTPFVLRAAFYVAIAGVGIFILTMRIYAIFA